MKNVSKDLSEALDAALERLDYPDPVEDGAIAGAASSYARTAHRQLASWPLPFGDYRPSQEFRWNGPDFWRPSKSPRANLLRAAALCLRAVEEVEREAAGNWTSYEEPEDEEVRE